MTDQFSWLDRTSSLSALYQTFLNTASEEVNQIIGVSSLEPKNHVWFSPPRLAANTIRLTPAAIREKDKWFLTINSIQTQTLDGTLTALTTAYNVYQQESIVEFTSRVVCHRLKIDFDAGYGTAIGSPNIPLPLRRATILLAVRQLVIARGLTALGDIDSFGNVQMAGAYMAMARDLLKPWQRRIVVV